MKLIDEHCEEENPRVSCLPISASGALPQAAHQHLSPRAVMLSLVRPSVLPPCAYARHALPWGRQCPPPLCPQPATPLFAQTPPPPSGCCLKGPISSSVECGAFREKSGGIINQGSHRRRHVTLGRDPPVQTKQFDLKSFPLSSTLEKELQELL